MSPSDILKMVLKQGMVLALLGIGIGVVAALGLMRLLTSFLTTLLYEVKTTDIATFAIVSGTLFAVALLACYLPARRATKVDPLVAPDTSKYKPNKEQPRMLQDIRYAFRMLLKKPGFTLVVVLTLALGIGANAAIFSVVKGVLLNPLPYPEPEQLVTFHQSKPNFDTGAIPYLNFVDLQRENQTFSSMAVSRGAGFTLIGAGDAERVTARMVTADFFTVYGIQPTFGRNFTAEDDRQGADPVTIISERLWIRKFNSASDLIGKSITLDDRSYTVIGITRGTSRESVTDVFVPLGAWNVPMLKNRSSALGLHGVGRMKPGVTIEQANADLNRVMRTLAEAYPANNKGHGSRVIAFKQRLVGNVESTLLMLFAAVGLVHTHRLRERQQSDAGAFDRQGT